MTTWLPKLAHDSNGRPFAPDEVSRIVAYALSLPDRLAAVKKLEDAQKWVSRQLAEHVGPLAIEWGLPKDPFTTDFAAFLAAIGHACLADDEDALDETVVRPCVDLTVALELPPDAVAELFAVAWRALGTKLDPRSTTLLGPLFDRAADRIRSAALLEV